MKYIDLSEDEIAGIHSFVKAVRPIHAVECVYVLPFFSEKTNQERISVITVRNNTPSYNFKMYGFTSIRDISKEREQLRLVMDQFEREYADARLSFIEEPAENYTLNDSNPRQELSERELVSGVILYDRFGSKKINRDQASVMYDSFSNTLKIGNFNEFIEYKPTQSKAM